MIELDNLHYDYRAIDGYNKPFNFVVSPREPGKTSMMWLKKIYWGWKEDHRPWIYIVRQSVEITDALIESIADTTLNKFTDDEVKFDYKSSNFKDGIVDVYILERVKKTQMIQENGEFKETEVEEIKKSLFFRIVALSIKMRRIKLAVLKDIKNVFMDEYIINPRMQEKYLPMEAEKIKEAFTTWRRENPKIKFYFAGNPYSLHNPLFMDWNVEIAKCKLNTFYVGDIFVIHFATLSEGLRAKLLEENPLYKFDEDYADYALYGKPINDKNIRIDTTMPKNFHLRFVMRNKGTNLCIYQTNDFNEDFTFYVKESNEFGVNRDIYCFEFEELVERSIVMSLDERLRLQKFKDAFRKRLVVFYDINCYYLIEEIYKNI